MCKETATWIGALAKQAGCDTETIRYYEREGLLQKPARTAAGYRSYTSEHLAQLNFVLHCRSLGMTLAEIKTLQSCQANPNLACTDINVLLDRHMARVHQQIKALQRLEKQLLALRNRCHETLKASACGILKTLINAAGGRECVCHPMSDSQERLLHLPTLPHKLYHTGFCHRDRELL